MHSTPKYLLSKQAYLWGHRQNTIWKAVQNIILQWQGCKMVRNILQLHLYTASFYKLCSMKKKTTLPVHYPINILTFVAHKISRPYPIIITMKSHIHQFRNSITQNNWYSKWLPISTTDISHLNSMPIFCFLQLVIPSTKQLTTTTLYRVKHLQPPFGNCFLLPNQPNKNTPSQKLYGL